MSKTSRFFTSVPVTREMFDYENAIKTLNTLQSNASVLKSAERISRHNNVYETKKYLARTGVNLDDFENKIPVIHVSGTKGKGSTCTACEAILRSHGYKTGLFTSPHLVCVRERILISGQPLEYSNFADRFWDVYNQLFNNREHEKDMPAYFKFLTVMALQVFIKEKIDVAIIEVGIGGELDCTNVFRKTPIVGITSLGLDHTSILGNTVEKIAWQKAGIIKPGSKVFTTSTHAPSVLKVLKDRAAEINAILQLVPSVNEYNINMTNFNPTLKLNASLAIQLANAFLKKEEKTSMVTKVCATTIKALKNCQIPGRFQIVTKGNFVYYLDGAHTRESTEYCSRWFDSIVPSLEREFTDMEEILKSRTNQTPFFKDLLAQQVFLARIYLHYLYHCVKNKNIKFYFEISEHESSKSLNDWDLLEKIQKATEKVNFLITHINGSGLDLTKENSSEYWFETPLLENMEICISIIKEIKKNERRVLLFNLTRNRDPTLLLEPFSSIKFNLVVFSPNMVTTNVNKQPKDLVEKCVTREDVVAISEKNRQAWLQLVGDCGHHTATCILNALDTIEKSNIRTHVLVTGSLHLVGSVLSVLEPEMRN